MPSDDFLRAKSVTVSEWVPIAVRLSARTLAGDFWEASGWPWVVGGKHALPAIHIIIYILYNYNI